MKQMNKEQKRYLKEIKALLPVYGKYEKRFFRDIKDSISELESESHMNSCVKNWGVLKI